MEEEKYQKKVKIINQINQYTDKINQLSIELEEDGLDNTKHYSKLTKGLSFITFFVSNERKYLKKLRKEHYAELNKK